MYFTLQPGGAMLQSTNGPLSAGIQLVYPNTSGYKTGTRLDYDAYDSEGVGWFVYGKGTVTPDGRRIVPDPGTSIYHLTCAFLGSPSTAPAIGPPPGSNVTDGEPVDLATGLFVYNKTDFLLPDVIPIVFTRTYRPADQARSLGYGMRHSYDLFLIGEQVNNCPAYTDIILPDGGRIYYPLSPCGTAPHTGTHTATPTRFYGSTVSVVPDGGTITLKDGTVYTLSVVFNSQGGDVRVSAIQDRNGNQLTISWYYANPGWTNFDRRVKRITSPNGKYLEFSYGDSSFNNDFLITQIRDNTGRTVNYTYDTAGHLSQVADTARGVTKYTYDSNNRMLTITDPKNITYLTNVYDVNGRVSKQTLADGSVYSFVYTLNKNGAVTQTQVTDPNGTVRTVVFNASGYVTSDTVTAGRQSKETYTFSLQSGSNFPLSVTDPLSRTTAYTYDSCGNPASITQLSGTSSAVTTSFAHQTGSTCISTFNLLTSVTDPLNHTTSFSYDSAGNLTTIADPLNNQTTLTYNSAGQPLTAANSAGSWQFGYTSGDLTSISDQLGGTSTRVVDSSGRLVTSIDAAGQASYYAYDALNELLSISDPLGGLTAFTYDPNGNLLTVADPRNGTTTYTYDNRDRLATRVDPLQATETYTYDGNSNLTQFKDRKAQMTTFAYDAFNRRTKAAFADSSSISYTYDLGNRVTQAVDTIAGTNTLTYDGLDRVTKEVSPKGTVSYVYDNASRRTSMTVLGQTQITYGYDNANRFTGLAQGTSTVSLGYDTANRRTSLTLPNGVVVQYGYDSASRLTALTYMKGSTTIGNLTYGYDLTGNRTSMGGSLAAVSLPSALGTTTYNAANRLTQWGSSTLAWDANGNLTSDSVKTYTWNARNQLGSMTGASFQYDAFGRRILNAAGHGILYDGVNPVQELSGSTVTANLITGLGVDEVFTRTDSVGTRSFLADALGSTVSLTDANGAVQTQYSYGPFGATTATGATSANSFEFTGRENDGTGLYYYRARYYNSTLQRFISEDPLEFGGGDTNLYGYLGQDPINDADPFGLLTFNDLSNAIAGAGDSLTFGGTSLVRRLINGGCDPANTSSTAYKVGEATEVATEIGLTLGSGALKQAAKEV